MKKQFFKFSVVLLTAAVTVWNLSCDDKKEDPLLSVAPSVVRDVLFSADGVAATASGIDFSPAFTVTTNVKEWNAVSDHEEWLTVEKQGNTFTLKAKVNTSLDPPADAKVTVTAGDALPVVINVKQSGAAPTLSLSSTADVVIDYEGTAATAGTLSYTVTTNYAGWDAVSSQTSWLTVNKSQAEKTFTLSAQENENTSPRSATVTVSAGSATAIVLQVTQEANPGGIETPPPAAAVSTQTWTVEDANQVWCDYIEYDGDGKVAAETISNYTFGTTEPDYRNDPLPSEGYLYNWYYIKQYEQDLCPSPWRVPTRQDYLDLHIALGGDTGDDGNGDIVGKGDETLVNKYKSLGFKRTSRIYNTAIRPDPPGNNENAGWLLYLERQAGHEHPSNVNLEAFGIDFAGNVVHIDGHQATNWNNKASASPVRCVRDIE